jgi:hypothetical protein
MDCIPLLNVTLTYLRIIIVLCCTSNDLIISRLICPYQGKKFVLDLCNTLIRPEH